MQQTRFTQPIQTARLLLRRFELHDAPDVFRNWASDSEVTRFLRWPAHADLGVTQRVLQQWLADYETADTFHWAVTLRGTQEPIGAISLVDVHRHDETAEVGYCLGRSFWGQGIMTEALRGVLRFCFVEAGFNRVYAAHSRRNSASGRVMQKAGLLHEGTLRQNYRSNLGFEDCELYALVREDWLKTQKDGTSGRRCSGPLPG